MSGPEAVITPSKHWVTAFLDMTQQGARRKAVSNAFIVFGDVVPVLAGLLTLFVALKGIKPQEPWVIAVALVLTAFAVAAKVFKSYLDRREKEIKAVLEAEKAEALASVEQSFDLGAKQGAEAVLSNWSEVARLHEDGMEKAHRQLQEGMRFAADSYASTDAVDSYLKAINATFEAFYDSHEGGFTASLAVSNSARTTLHLVRIEPGGRGRSTPLPRAYDLADQAWGMAEAFNTGKIVYTPDVCRHGNDGSRGYLSVVNLPVRNMNGATVAVVNVDSPHLESFGSEARVQEVWHYCLPLLSSLSLCLSDPRIFRDERQ